MSTKFKLKVKEFKRMESPNQDSSNITKYVCFAQCNDMNKGLKKWMDTNPRCQNLRTDVAKDIQDSLESNNNFHNLNKGIVFSVEKISYDNKEGIAEFSMSNSEIHGNIDGGHTLIAILKGIEEETIDDDKYVFIEFYTGLTDTVQLAETRNRAVPVDEVSIQELKGTFDVLHDILEKLPFSDRIRYKMNQFYGEDKKAIDAREIIAIIMMFSDNLYPKKSEGTLSDKHPIQCYSGKEATLRKFIKIGDGTRDKMLENMRGIIPQIFDLWDEIECHFTEKSKDANKRYGARKYSKYDEGKIIEEKSMFYENELKYFIPKGIMYPLVGAFRALIEIDKNGKYSFKDDPKKVWDKVGSKLINAILEEDSATPDVLAKNNNLWNNLFMLVYVNTYMKI